MENTTRDITAVIVKDEIILVEERSEDADVNTHLVHQESLSGEAFYVREECGRCFDQKEDFDQHQRVHNGQKVYGCKECRKNFSFRSLCIVHQRIHTGTKPCLCQECAKAFGWKSNLIQHRRIHTREKPFECKECGKGFSQNTSHTQCQVYGFSIPGRSHIPVRDVGIVLLGMQSFFNFREFTLGRNFMNVRALRKASCGTWVSLGTPGSTLERSLVNVLTVRKALFARHISLIIRESILGKDPRHVTTVGKPSLRILF